MVPEQAPSQAFGTNRKWVEVAGPELEATLGSQHPAATLLLRETAFVPAGSPGGTVHDVLSLGNPPTVWDRVRSDPQPISSSYIPEPLPQPVESLTSRGPDFGQAWQESRLALLCRHRSEVVIEGRR